MPRRIRRSSPEVRLEVMPLLDVVFLLLTFFIFALVLMVRADVLGISLPTFGAGRATSGSATISITLDEHGAVWVDGDNVALDDLADVVSELRDTRPEAKILVAVDTEGQSGALLELVDRLSAAGLTDFSLLGRATAGGAGPGSPAGADP